MHKRDHITGFATCAAPDNPAASKSASTVSTPQIDPGKAARQGGLWSVIAYGFAKVTGFASTIVLARLLMPEHFGMMAMVTTVIAMVQMVGQWGIWAAIIHEREDHLECANTGWWLDVTISAGLFVLANALSPLAAIYYHQPILRGLIFVASINFLIKPLGNMMGILLSRNLQFKTNTRIELASSLAGSTFTILLALLGFGVWSFVYPTILASVTMVSLQWRVSSFRPKLPVRWDLSRRILGFGKFMFGAGIFSYINENTSYILVGGLMGGTELGLYLFAYNLGTWIVQNISTVVMGFLFPTVASIQHDHARARSIFLRLVQVISFAGFPLVALQWALAPLFIGSIYGEKWLPSVTAFRLIAAYGIGRAVCQPALNLISAMGRPDINFKISAATSPVLVAAIFLGTRGGINGVALATAVAHGLFVWLYVIIPFRTLGWDVRGMLAAVAPAFVSSLIAGAVTAAIYSLIGGPTDSLPRLALLGTAGAAVYAGAMLTLFRKTTLDMAGVVKTSLREARE